MELGFLEGMGVVTVILLGALLVIGAIQAFVTENFIHGDLERRLCAFEERLGNLETDEDEEA